MGMPLWNALNSAYPVDLGAQSDLIGVPEPRRIGAVLADQIAGGRALPMTFYVTHPVAKEGRSQTGRRSGAGSALGPRSGALLPAAWLPAVRGRRIRAQMGCRGRCLRRQPGHRVGRQ